MKASERQAVVEAIEAPEAVQIVRLRQTTTTDNNNDNCTTTSELAVANIHVTWSQLKYPALQALQVRLVHYAPLVQYKMH